MLILFPHTSCNTNPGTPLGKCQRTYYDTIPHSVRSKSFDWSCQYVLHMKDISRLLFVGVEDVVEVHVDVAVVGWGCSVDGAHGQQERELCCNKKIEY